MPRYTTRRRVPFSARQMFDLVADVEKYPEFLPLCEALRVRRRMRDGEGREVLVANMEVGYKAIRESFTSQVTLDPAANRILVTYLDGPFSHLDNRWTFHQLEQGSDIDFLIDYEFRNIVLQMLMGAMFDTAFRRFADAFEARAREVYARPAT